MDIKHFKSNYEKEWIRELKDDYTEMIDSLDIRSGFYSIKEGLGNYMAKKETSKINPEGRNNSDILKVESTRFNISDWFERLLYAPNIGVLDYILNNKSQFKDLVFIDYGSGYGLLSIFLKKIGIECYNCDSFKQLRPLDILKQNKLYNKFIDKYKINTPKKLLTQHEMNKLNVLVCIGPPTLGKFIKEKQFKYIFLDIFYSKNAIFGWKDYKYERVKLYENLTAVYTEIKDPDLLKWLN